ncbi:Fcf1-domain-containing protein [Rhodofomes roseus]|uniref:Fcf1-domain-containing protein n=1 Tax=Rhodofomes roseus TaxID=34475 RepID=A0ABQ8KDB4_9APHY|nr:Fcf1-domain-containing protein [Rhodofomes roseus]KAH9835629.1 Fcf1-domain-containing protein [Rhodofomes roseus]
MRQKRAKAYRKLMSLYCMSFGFRQPYQVLVDSEMCKSSITQKLELSKQLETVLQGTVKPMITQCCIHELYLQGKEQQPAVDLAKTFERRKCNHREAIPGDECLASVVGETNKHRYVIATQSHDLRVKLRTVPAVPLVHINRSVMILEPPSKATLEAKESAEEQVLHPSAPEIATLPSTSTPAEAPKRKMKGPKGPNPLSVKKKKPKVDPSAPNKAANESEQGHAGAKRTRGEDADGNVDGGEEPSSQGAGRKRKRRKKMGDNEPDHEPRGDTP